MLIFCISVVHVLCIFLNIWCTVNDVLSIALCWHRSWRVHCLLEWRRIRKLLWLYSCHLQRTTAFGSLFDWFPKKFWLFHQSLFLDWFFLSLCCSWEMLMCIDGEKEFHIPIHILYWFINRHFYKNNEEFLS